MGLVGDDLAVLSLKKAEDRLEGFGGFFRAAASPVDAVDEPLFFGLRELLEPPEELFLFRERRVDVVAVPLSILA